MAIEKITRSLAPEGILLFNRIAKLLVKDVLPLMADEDGEFTMRKYANDAEPGERYRQRSRTFMVSYPNGTNVQVEVQCINYRSDEVEVPDEVVPGTVEIVAYES